MSTCLQTYVDIKHYHAYPCTYRSLCAHRNKHIPVYFPPGKGTRRKEEKHLSLSLSLSLSLAFILVVIVVEPNLSRLDSRTFENSSSIEKREKTILRYPSLKESRFLNFKSLLSFFFFQFIIYNAFARNATTYFKSFHICHLRHTCTYGRCHTRNIYILYIYEAR